jgi:N-acetylneuraminic acid mutarotase
MLAPCARMSSVVANGCLYAIGGEGNYASPRGVFEENEILNLSASTWQRLEPLPTAIHGLTGAAFLNESLYVPGGATARGVSGDNVSMKLQVFCTDLVC